MPINFPDSPAENDSFTSGGKKWIFNGTVWTLVTANSYTIPTGEVTTAKILDANVTAGKLASNAVTEAKINDGAVTQAKLASGLSGITVTTTANRSAVIPSPFNGQFIFLTDTSQLQRWDGSAWVVAITTVPTAAPTSVAVSGSPTSNSVTLTFSAGADGGSSITNYEYALSTNAGSTYGSYTALSPADASSPITITGLSLGTAYLVKLKAVNALGTGSSESSAVSFTTTNFPIEYLVVAGGGGAGTGHGGGGGAGGFRTNVSGATSGGGASAEAALTLALNTYTVTVGAGGARLSAGATTTQFTDGNQGSNSVFSTITSTGGGYGGGWEGRAGNTGGSGGGRAGHSASYSGGAAGISNQGYAGGTNAHYCGGGGGGAGGVGGTAVNDAAGGAGGAGVNLSITGTSVGYAGGGGGGCYPASGVGGTATHGGANGNALDYGVPGNGGIDAVANKGGGGGGSGGNWATGGAGGSGVVIVRYLTAEASNRTITGGTATTSGSYTVRTFTASGSLVIS